MTVIEKEVAEKTKYVETVKALRARNFSKNIPFLILSDKLPEGQVYREFPDGHIELQTVSSAGGNFNSIVIKTLSLSEALAVRKEHGLF